MIEQFWYRVRPSHLVLYPLSLIFAAIGAARRAMYRTGWRRTEHLPVPVVVVGNIAVGGTGKTPLVLWLSEFLQERGHRPGIVTRGYGGSERLQEVRPDSDPMLTGDEAALLARRLRCDYGDSPLKNSTPGPSLALLVGDAFLNDDVSAHARLPFNAVCEHG